MNEENKIEKQEKQEKSVSKNSAKNINLITSGYILVKVIGSGSFGEVYLAEHLKSGGYVAAKVEYKQKAQRIINEYKIYKYLNRKGFTIGIPKIYDLIQTQDNNIMFMQLLGPSLEDLFNKYNRKFTLSTVLLLADQLIVLLETLHTSDFIHRDIKPNNFLIGRNENLNQIYMMDFGLSKRYVINDKHMKFRDKRSLIGTARYASINMHMGIEPSRRDDLESIGYMLIYFIKGSLPWQGIKKKKGINNLEVIGEIKMCTSLDILCQNLPNCFKEYLTYCKQLKFDEKPNYKNLRNLFQKACTELKINPQFQWC